MAGRRGESPINRSSKVYKCKDNKFRCKNTGKYFNVKTNTLFDSSKVELRKWFVAIWLVTSHKKGISSAQLSRDIDVTQKTAWFMLQRIRNCFGISNDIDEDVNNDNSHKLMELLRLTRHSLAARIRTAIKTRK